jgi:hypothetical protein
MDNAIFHYYRVLASFEMFHLFNIINMFRAFNLENYKKRSKGRCRLDTNQYLASKQHVEAKVLRRKVRERSRMHYLFGRIQTRGRNNKTSMRSKTYIPFNLHSGMAKEK